MKVAIAGGGLAGIAAACALASAGHRVTVFEQRPYLGGRASSHEQHGVVLDNCQHVLLGCCTNLLDFYQRIGVADRIRWYDRLTFLLPAGDLSPTGAPLKPAVGLSGNEESEVFGAPHLPAFGRSGNPVSFTLAPSFLPAPFHAAPSFLAARGLTILDKLAIARAMLRLARPIADDGGTSFAAWLRAHGQTSRAIARFWTPVLVSALNDELDRVSVSAGAMVFREAFLNSAEAGRMGLSSIPLSDLYAPAADYIRSRGGEVRTRCTVASVKPSTEYVGVEAGGETIRFDALVLALPWHKCDTILPGMAPSARELPSSPITGIHLWFDREVTALDHAVMLDRTIQWMFNKTRILGGTGTHSPEGSYLELVVSASHSLLSASREAILDLALRELAEFFPRVQQAKLLRATVVKEVHATFSPAPGSDALRPSQRTAHPRVFLAGDWTRTGWPATMEGAVRSGYLAAEAICAQPFLVPDLPRRGIMRWFAAT